MTCLPVATRLQKALPAAFQHQAGLTVAGLSVSEPIVLAGILIGAMVPFLLLTAFYHEWRMSAMSLVALPLLGYPLVRLGKRLRRASTINST